MAELYIVATPIGNLKDITHRAIEILSSVDIVAAEDTRRTQQLLSALKIKAKKLISLHEHNENSVSNLILTHLENNLSIALVSDAGTPLISDPGAILVQKVRNSGYKVIPIPGANAAISLLSVAGLAEPHFLFYGFLSAKTKHRNDELTELKNLNIQANLIFYEAPHRIIETVESFIQIFDNSQLLTIGRELTKQFETIYQDNLSNCLAYLNADANHQRGEFVLILSPKPKTSEENQPDPLEDLEVNIKITELISLLKQAEVSTKDASALIKKLTNLPKDKIYKFILDNY